MDKLRIQLETNLQTLCKVHQQLVALIQRKQLAMRQAQPDVMEDCCKRENNLVQQIGELEKQRQQLVGQITQHINPQATTPLTLVAIADTLEEPHRGRLLVLHQQLRAAIQQAKDENAIAKQAGQRLLSHMKGMMQAVSSAVSAGTYSRRGNIHVNTQTSGTISITG